MIKIHLRSVRQNCGPWPY